MTSPDLHAVITPLLLEALFADPLIFIAGWLLLGWLLLHAGRRDPATDGPAIDHWHQNHEDHGLSVLQLALLGVSLYVLLRYWRNR